MKRLLFAAICAMAGLVATVAGQEPSGGGAAAPTASATFHKDVLPILQKNCQSCHRPGQIGPFSMMTFETTRPWVRAIKTRVVNRQMPPWFADPHAGQFANDTSLKQADIDTISKWVDAGAPQGDPAHAPKAKEWPSDGWQIKPDVIVRGPEFRVPARPPKNVIEWADIVASEGQPYWLFSEPDLDGEHTALATFSAGRPFANLPLAGREVAMA